jgi:hypothetical protein
MSHEPQPSAWIGLCLVTESNYPFEWPAVAAVIRNRIDSRRFPSTAGEVVLQPKQFSAFNPFTPAEPTFATWERVIYSMSDARRAQVKDAIPCAAWVLSLPVWRLPFAPTVCHYYSPVSMIPKWSEPKWAKQAKRLFTPSGIDPKRFVFADGVP